MNHADQCRCGAPAGGNLCRDCGDHLRTDLTKIADRWPDLEAALTAPSAGGEKGRTKHGMRTVGTALNEQAAKARRQCADVVWFVVQVIRDDRDTAGLHFHPPAVPAGLDATPILARWIADWQVAHITHTTARETAEEIADDLAAAERSTWDAVRERHRRVPTGLPCEGHDDPETGQHHDCPGSMEAKLGDVMPDLVCTLNRDHRIPAAVWSRSYWKRHVPLNQSAAERLAGAIIGK